MSQAAILERVKEEPGVLQDSLPELTGLNKQSIQKNIKGLIGWGRIKRKRTGRTYTLWLA